MTNNQLTENSVNQLLNSIRLARDNAERADNRVDHSFYYALTIALEELQERRKADSEPVELPRDYLQGHKDGLEWASQLAEANHPETGDWLYDDPIELAKAIRKGPDMPPVQPVADSEPVAWTWQHLKQWYVTNDEERARELAWDGVKVEQLYRHAQPVPVVSADLLHTAASAIEDLLTIKDRTGACVWFDLPFRLRSAANAQPEPEYPEVLPCSVLLEPGLRFGKGIKTSTMLAALARRAVHESDMAALSPEERVEFQARIEDFKALIAQPAPVVPDKMTAIVKDEAEYVEGWNACRAAMLQELKKSAGTEAICRSDENVQVLHTKSPAQSDCCPAQNHVSPEQNGDTPAQSQGWIQVSEQMPENDGAYLCWDNRYVTTYAFIFGAWQANQFVAKNITHWMPLPAAPQEVNRE